ncbi:LAFA_0G24520g1_1 [Lachancea sp. 'fantastica']|nr:LAFA_0G24520g1_1 [Lachancea sp. 'fantastica']
MSNRSIKKYLNSNPNAILVLDGGQGSELENRGIEVANPIWSTIPFVNESFWSNPASKDREIVSGMYRDYLASGSQGFTTVTYQASFKLVSENTVIKTPAAYVELLSRIIAFTRECIGSDKWLVGSIGPWGAHNCSEFTGEYGPEPEKIDYLGYFEPQLSAFNGNGNLDLIAFETIPNFHELKAILSWDESLISKPFYIGLSLHDNGKLRDGTSLQKIGEYIKSLGPKLNSNFTLLGVNCVSFDHSQSMLEELHELLPELPLIAYPNSGEVYDSVQKVWTSKKVHGVTWDFLVKKFIESGVRMIGGCCRTTPADIKKISDAVHKYSKERAL